ncbi:MAG: ABC-type lipoprotein export system ATPase subunit [Colwellia sp.]|jgi:hypothetical protein
MIILPNLSRTLLTKSLELRALCNTNLTINESDFVAIRGCLT